MADTARWYVVHTYSGYENTVKATIEKTVESRGLHDQILAISIPLETVTEITESGVSKTYDRKVYPVMFWLRWCTVMTPGMSSNLSAVSPASWAHPATIPFL